jgi:hypothetical protein
MRQGAGANGQVVDLVGGEEVGFDAVDVAPLAPAADVAHALLVGFLHGLAADVGLAQEVALGVEYLYLVLVFLPDLRLRGAGSTMLSRRVSCLRSAWISASRLRTSKRVSIR